MILVEIFSKEDCHLCDVAKEVVRNVRSQVPFQLKEINIAEGDEWYERYHERIPVIHINGAFAFQHKVSARQLIERLNETAQK